MVQVIKSNIPTSVLQHVENEIDSLELGGQKFAILRAIGHVVNGGRGIDPGSFIAAIKRMLKNGNARAQELAGKL